MSKSNPLVTEVKAAVSNLRMRRALYFFKFTSRTKCVPLRLDSFSYDDVVDLYQRIQGWQLHVDDVDHDPITEHGGARLEDAIGANIEEVEALEAYIKLQEAKLIESRLVLKHVRVVGEVLFHVKDRATKQHKQACKKDRHV